MAFSTQEKKIYNLISKPEIKEKEMNMIISFIKENPEFLFVQTKMNSTTKTSLLFHAVEHNLSLAEKIIDECNPNIIKITNAQSDRCNIVHYLAKNKESISGQFILNLFKEGRQLHSERSQLMANINMFLNSPVMHAFEHGNNKRAKEITDHIKNNLLGIGKMFSDESHIVYLTGKNQMDIYSSVADNLAMVEFADKNIYPLKDYLKSIILPYFIKKMFSNDIDTFKKVTYLQKNAPQIDMNKNSQDKETLKEIFSHFVKKTQCDAKSMELFLTWLIKNYGEFDFKLNKPEAQSLFHSEISLKERKKKLNILFDKFGKDCYPKDLYSDYQGQSSNVDFIMIKFMLEKNIVIEPGNYKTNSVSEVYLNKFIDSFPFDIQTVSLFIEKHKAVYQQPNNRALSLLCKAYNYHYEEYQVNGIRTSKMNNKDVIFALLENNANALSYYSLSPYFDVPKNIQEKFPETVEFKRGLFENIIINIEGKSKTEIKNEFNNVCRSDLFSPQKVNPVMIFLLENENFITNDIACQKYLTKFLEKEHDVPEEIREIMNYMHKMYLNNNLNNQGTIKNNVLIRNRL